MTGTFARRSAGKQGRQALLNGLVRTSVGTAGHSTSRTEALICVRCGRVVEFAHERLERMLPIIAVVEPLPEVPPAIMSFIPNVLNAA